MCGVCRLFHYKNYFDGVLLLEDASIRLKKYFLLLINIVDTGSGSKWLQKIKMRILTGYIACIDVSNGSSPFSCSFLTIKISFIGLLTKPSKCASEDKIPLPTWNTLATRVEADIVDNVGSTSLCCYCHKNPRRPFWAVSYLSAAFSSFLFI